MAAIRAQKSTIVRAEISPRLRRFALALTEREAPALGARLAVRMWMTLPAAPAAISRPQLAPPGKPPAPPPRSGDPEPPPPASASVRLAFVPPLPPIVSSALFAQ